MKEIGTFYGETIKICSYHQEKEHTPLIYTFAFIGSEYWCPACGANYGMLGAGDNVPFTWWLHNRRIKYKALARKFLRARCLMVCAYFRYKGKEITFEELPEKSQQYWKNQKWNYKF
jgi:hypothetical protein